jgi:thiosulfate dehydrogenase
MILLYKKTLLTILVIPVLIFLSYATGGGVSSGDPEVYKNADIVLGALLYDKWYTVKDAETSGTHPLYPASGKKKGATTWRCKECHGWDYIGKDGRYSKGSHFTGIKGVYDARTGKSNELYDALTDAEINHDFSKYLVESDIWAMVKFIREGLIDIKTVINIDGSITGNPENGRSLYESNCSTCHGKDGNEIDFKKKEGIQGVGWLSNDNPQESLHKIRWGHPGSGMTSAVVDKRLSDSETIDILSFIQTLKN